MTRFIEAITQAESRRILIKTDSIEFVEDVNGVITRIEDDIYIKMSYDEVKALLSKDNSIISLNTDHRLKFICGLDIPYLSQLWGQDKVVSFLKDILNCRESYQLYEVQSKYNNVE